MQSVKCVIVGDGAVGKTSLLITYTQGTFPTDYIPTIFDNYAANLFYKGGYYSLGLWDTAGQEEYDRLRPLSYPQTDVFLLVYSIVNPNSYNNIRHKWYPELTHYCPSTPILLVGNKEDLREDVDSIERLKTRGHVPVTHEQGLSLSRDINASGFYEVSAMTRKNLSLIFEKCIDIYSEKQVMNKPKKNKNNRRCIIL